MNAEGLQPKFPLLQTGARRRHLDRRLMAAAVVLVTGGAVAAVVALTGGGAGSAEASAPVAADSVGLFRAASGRPLGQTPVGTSPGAIAADSQAVWVANADSGSLSRLDPDTGAQVQTIQVGDGPAGVALGGGFVWVTNSLDGTVSQIDPGTNVPVQTIRVGSQPAGVAYGLGGVWVANRGDRTLTKINPATGRVRKTIPLGTGVDALAVGAGALWVASELNGTVERIDPQSGATQTINVGRAPDAVAVGAGSVWVANNLDGTVSRIDPATNAVANTIAVGAGPVAIAAASGGRSVWVGNELAGTLDKIDPARDRVSKTLELGNRPEGVALAGQRLYAAVRTSGGAHRGGTLTVAYQSALFGSMEDNFDPANGYRAWQFAGLTNDGLVAFRRAGGGEGLFLVPDLATSLPAPTDSGRSYTFQLRPGIRYSTGQPLRPGDFRRPIERALQLGGGIAPASYFSGIVGAAACVRHPRRCDLSRGITSGANTVTFHLSRPDPEFLYKLALPTADAEPADTALKPRLPLPETGPYMLTRFDPFHQLARFARNPRFRQWSAAARPDGYPDAIVTRWDTSADDAVRAVEHGTVDLTPVLAQTSAPLLAALRIRYRGQLHSDPLLQTGGSFLNTTVPPFNNPAVRRALNYAIDRRRLVALLGGPEFATPTCQIVPPNIAGYRRYCPYMLGRHADAAYTGPDLAEARKLIAASHTRGQTITLYEILLSTADVEITQSYLATVLRSLGYKTQLLALDLRDFFTQSDDSRYRWQEGPYKWVTDYPSPSSFFLPLLTCASYKPATPTNLNASEFCDRRIDREIAHAQSLDASDPQAAAALWAKIDHNITDQSPWLTYVNSRDVELVSSRVGNYVYSASTGGPLLDQLWVR